MGGAPKAPAEAGSPAARQERAARSCRRDLGSTGCGRVVLLPGLVDCREHVDTATARPGAPREPLGTRCQRRRTQAHCGQAATCVRDRGPCSPPLHLQKQDSGLDRDFEICMSYEQKSEQVLSSHT